MSLAFQRLVQHRELALKEGAKIVRNVIAKTPTINGYTTHELYDLALKEAPPPNYQPMPRTTPPPPKAAANKKRKVSLDVLGPPHPEHPVRSMAFLKNTILPFLEGSRELRKIHIKQDVTNAPAVQPATKKSKASQKKPSGGDDRAESVWLWKPIDPSELPPLPTNKVPKLFGTELGGGEDLSHLNKRRATERRAEIRKELHELKMAAGIENYRQRSLAGAELRKKQEEQRQRAEQNRVVKGIPNAPPNAQDRTRQS